MKRISLPDKDIAIAGLAALGIALHLAAGSPLPLYAVLALGGAPLAGGVLRKALSGDLGADLLAALSIVTAALMGQLLVGAIVVLMLSGGAALERFAGRRASSVLAALARRMPRAAHRKEADGLRDVDLSQLSVGDVLVVLPHEICPVDGLVVEGHGAMDEAYLTGEPFEISKAPGSRVLSGAVNGEAALSVKAARRPVDSRYAQIVRVMETAEKDRPRIRRLADRLAFWYAPLSLSLAAGAWLLSGDPLRFLAVLVVATPCPLLIAIPVAVIGAISLAARQGIIIRNPAVLEQVTRCKTLIFDKTGTLTSGRPTLTDVLCAPGFERQDVLWAAASLEQYSKHPLSAPILKAAGARALACAAQMSETPGQGLEGVVGGRRVRITGRAQAPDTAGLPPPAEGLECLVFLDGRFAAAFLFHDAPRSDSRQFLQHLPHLHEVTKVMLVSGDREAAVRYLAASVGITEVHAGKSPEEKVAIVKRETGRAQTLFVGDGINDAPALMAATVGVAFGPNSEVTSQAAGAVIMTASLGKVDELIHIGRRMRAIALQSAIGGMALSGLGMAAAAAGQLTPVQGAIAQELIDLAAILNALRMAVPPRALTDF